jgi:hypothetical protein
VSRRRNKSGVSQFIFHPEMVEELQILYLPQVPPLVHIQRPLQLCTKLQQILVRTMKDPDMALTD